jgi:hypothetical protein
VPAGNYGEAVLQVAYALCAELGYAGTGDVPGGQSMLGAAGPMAEVLSAEDESLVMKLREALAKIAAAVGAKTEDPDVWPVWSALDGAEMTIRGELVHDQAERLPQLMPSLVFLVVLPIVDQDKALELSRRTTELIAKALDG